MLDSEQTQTDTPTESLLIGTKTGKCDICKAQKRVYLLNYGFCLCEDCLRICAHILEQLEELERPRGKGA
jgi:hypothetical protein